jgi:hypothetical protein
VQRWQVAGGHRRCKAGAGTAPTMRLRRHGWRGGDVGGVAQLLQRHRHADAPLRVPCHAAVQSVLGVTDVVAGAWRVTTGGGVQYTAAWQHGVQYTAAWQHGVKYTTDRQHGVEYIADHTSSSASSLPCLGQHHNCMHSQHQHIPPTNQATAGARSTRQSSSPAARQPGRQRTLAECVQHACVLLD